MFCLQATLILSEEQNPTMISTTSQSKFRKILFKILKIIAVTAFWILVWEAVSRLVARGNETMYLLLPRPVTVFETWLDIAFTAEYLAAVGKTLLRVFWGFLLGCVLGFGFGIATHTVKVVDILLSPMLKMIRAVPVVAITILFFALFKTKLLRIGKINIAKRCLHVTMKPVIV